MLKIEFLKPVSMILCAALSLGGVGAAYAAGLSKSEIKEEKEVSTEAEAEQETQNIEKDETVYVIAGADGSVQKIIVSDWIKNSLGRDKILDSSELNDPENVKGDESYTVNGDGARVWDADGNDIYYMGNIEKELPVNISVSYKLDRKSIAPDELKGKSGKVTIRFDYKNNQYETVEIDGKKEKMYVPFVMLTGMLFDNDVFTNVDVSGGKLINDGSRTAVVGVTLPGLQENLKLDPEKLEIPSFVEITADVRNFEMNDTVTIATNEVFNKINTEKLSSADDLTDSLDQLTDAMNRLMDGSSQLYSGLCTLLEKSGELISGINKLAEGAAQVKNGSGALRDGSAELQKGAAELSDGLNILDSNSAKLNDGAKTVFDSLLSMAETQIRDAGVDIPNLTIDNYKDVLDKVIVSLDGSNVLKIAQDTARVKVTAAVNSQRNTIKSAVTDAVRAEIKPKIAAAVRSEVEPKVEASVRAEVKVKVFEAVKTEVANKVTEEVKTSVTSQVLASMNMTPESYAEAVAAGSVSEEVQQAVSSTIADQMASEAVLKIISDTVDEQMASSDILNTINANTDNQMKSESIKAVISSKTDEQMNSEDIQKLISAKTEEQLSSVEIERLIELKTNEKTSELIEQNMNSSEVQNQITEALRSAESGAASISAAKAQLLSYNEFYSGLNQYTAGVGSAAGGATQLRNGADALSDGASQLDEGIKELYNGILTLKNGAPALQSGVSELRDGSLKLSEGLREFNEKGVGKLKDAVDGDLAGLLTRVKATVDVSKNYKSFSGISDEMSGQVKFIYKTSFGN